MFVQYSFVEHRAREVMRPEPVHFSEAGILALGGTFMLLASVAYVTVYGLV
jgi:hypothetical protein